MEMKTRRNYPEKLKSHKEHAIELYGMSFEDFELYCDKTGKPSYSRQSKTDFFKACNDCELVKKDGKLFLKGREL